MKKIFGNIAVTLLALFLLGLAFLIIPKLLAKQTSDLPRNALSSNPYPPPEMTQAVTPTLTPDESINPLTPAAPIGWPTDQPWPPLTATAIPLVTPEVQLFPTPQINYLDANASDENLDEFWYSSIKGKNAGLKLVKLAIDEKGKRKEKSKAEIPLDFGASAEYPRILSLQKTNDGAYIAYQASEREEAIWNILDNTSRLSERKALYQKG